MPNLREPWGTHGISELRLRCLPGFQVQEVGIWLLLSSGLQFLWDSVGALNPS